MREAVTQSISRTPATPSPVVFVHGLWLHASSWRPWIDAFRDANYEASAPGWPGEMSTVPETRAHPEAIANAGLDELVRYYAAFVSGIRPLPVLIGHAFGGLLVRRLVELGLAGGGIVIDVENGSLYPKTVNETGTCELEPDTFSAFYGAAITRLESDRLFDMWSIPAPPAALRDIGLGTAAHPNPANVMAPGSGRYPFLLIAGGPEKEGSFGRQAPIFSGIDVQRFSDRGLSLTIDSGWPEIAESCLAWLDAQEL